MLRAAVFSGTAEGREICGYLANKGAEVTESVATEYGRSLAEPTKNAKVKVRVGRLEAEGMRELIKNADFVIDATHPYAQTVTENIKAACALENKKYIRLLREDIAADRAIYADNIDEAVRLLVGSEGGIFVSTGSKELYKYAAIENYRSRITARVLPCKEAEDICRSLGLKNVIYAKGPFTYEENLKAFGEYSIKWLVTKSSGRAGGFEEKLKAAKALDISVIVIKRPPDAGIGMAQVKELIDREWKAWQQKL